MSIDWNPGKINIKSAFFETEWNSAISDPEELDADSIEEFIEGGKSDDRLYSNLDIDNWHRAIDRSRNIGFIIFDDILYTLLEFESDRDCDTCTNRFDRSQVEILVTTRAHRDCNDYPVCIFKANKEVNRQICLDLFPNCI